MAWEWQHLQSTAPAIDAGKNISSVTNGHDGDPRPQGAEYDIGAYERTGNTPPSAPKNLRWIN
jgi:hypothetical protein